MLQNALSYNVAVTTKEGYFTAFTSAATVGNSPSENSQFAFTQSPNWQFA